MIRATGLAILIEDMEHLIEDYCIQVQIAQQGALSGMLDHEFDRLMQAHHASAVPLPVLKREQERIQSELDTTNRRIEAHHGDYVNVLTLAHNSKKARTETINDGKGSSLVCTVELRGFEPLASSMPWKRATNCAIAPTCSSLRTRKS